MNDASGLWAILFAALRLQLLNLEILRSEWEGSACFFFCLLLYEVSPQFSGGVGAIFAGGNEGRW
jgi:hypothetical protein